MDKYMIDWMLSAAGALQVAAAHYDSATGRVDRVRSGKRRIASQADYDRLRLWLRHENAAGCNIWIRPAAPTHALVMLDDMPLATSRAIASKYRALAVERSPENCQAWLVCSRHLTREQRQDVARSLCRLIGSDPGAISEPRWGRLAGYRQRKPGKTGFMTRIIAAGSNRPALDPAPHLVAGAASSPAPAGGVVAFPSSISTPTGGDESRREFAFACHALKRGMTPAEVEAAIAAHVTATRRRKSAGYAALARLR